MNEQTWIQILTQFQARCRGYVMRQGLLLVQAQFEDIVREIDGGLDHLQWRGNIIPKPHFTDTKSLLLQYERSRFQCHDHQDDSEGEQKIENEDSEKTLPQSDIQVPERDEAPETSSRDTSTPVEEIGENVVGQNLAEYSSTVCNAVNSDVCHSSLLQTGTSLHSVLKDTAHTPDSLKQQRSTLAMELLWIQQAISSRKKYLTLKQRMDVSH
ncbi:IQ domain-containing protein C-like [Pimephales promelas]|uniref:IQ domain-containing protein C-like n=1 Tax=Pimephales promelas TaxID=90988 RepID=UPI001955AA21|nr:IQ domain-containing protein C-like [Pimephales promelas]XP_039528461.1 IQ domain-containing protein C-like [Pimephales promelas]KAG1950306.1 IQ domain-containing protein C [Pimephales promelas]KAG1950307.1 IQ domain-containing protein C [Pimephales promelas]